MPVSPSRADPSSYPHNRNRGVNCRLQGTGVHVTWKCLFKLSLIVQALKRRACYRLLAPGPGQFTSVVRAVSPQRLAGLNRREALHPPSSSWEPVHQEEFACVAQALSPGSRGGIGSALKPVEARQVFRLPEADEV
ncbi:uncharacterized protein LOC118242268 isoform X3 [Electrophorus electricus]|uniref:uncharacterized protein LOC118242268 isoform X3 n=1 Tax=Electrophorus electricus TaxID=8005 RepID=UPI0015CF8E44|nr:uncharacterized protein LOC118242268 isoform X3 [Electrophorus electricus]